MLRAALEMTLTEFSDWLLSLESQQQRSLIGVLIIKASVKTWRLKKADVFQRPPSGGSAIFATIARFVEKAFVQLAPAEQDELFRTVEQHDLIESVSEAQVPTAGEQPTPAEIARHLRHLLENRKFNIREAILVIVYLKEHDHGIDHPVQMKAIKDELDRCQFDFKSHNSTISQLKAGDRPLLIGGSPRKTGLGIELTEAGRARVLGLFKEHFERSKRQPVF